MKKIGVIFGMETTFPPALVDKINYMNLPGVQAELASVGEVRMAEPSPYHVIVDRISHDIPFYRGYLKNAVLCGATVINNPFWWSADDKFFNFALGQKLGVAIPATVLLPHKQHPVGTTDRSMRNLQFPMPWDSKKKPLPPKGGRGAQACLHFRIGAGLGGPACIDRLLLVDADLLRDVVPLSCRRIEDRLWIFACPEL